MSLLPRRMAVTVFAAFAFAYFLSALLRAITATLSPVLTQEFSLTARDLGLLAGGYFLGFAATQLPLGRWLDRHGPKRVILVFLSVAVLGCGVFYVANSFTALLLGRILCGVGVSACLMAPLTGYRRWLSVATQLRANSWMLMAGSMGMVASTLPVQWLLPLTGWRPLFGILAVLVLLAMAGIASRVPAWAVPVPGGAAVGTQSSYAQVWRHPYFRQLAPLGFICYGTLIAIQTLWAVPWMMKVAGYSAAQAAAGLFWINVAMLLAFWAWGLLNPRLARRGYDADTLIARGLPISLSLLLIVIVSANLWRDGAALLWGLFCVSATVVTLAQPAVALAFPQELAGRALSAFNLIVFLGIFIVQWGIGLLIDGFVALGAEPVLAFQAALSVLLFLCLAAYVRFVFSKRHNQTAQ